MTKELKLRRFNHSDISLFKKWVYEEHTAKWYNDPLSWIDEIEKRYGEFNWIHHFIVVLDQRDIGFCQFYEYGRGGENWHGDIELDGTYSIDYLIGETDCLNMGFGSDTIRLLTNTVFAIPRAKRIIVRPDPGNAASCKALLSAGFIYDPKNRLYIIGADSVVSSDDSQMESHR